MLINIKKITIRYGEACRCPLCGETQDLFAESFRNQMLAREGECICCHEPYLVEAWSDSVTVASASGEHWNAA